MKNQKNILKDAKQLVDNKGIEFEKLEEDEIFQKDLNNLKSIILKEYLKIIDYEQFEMYPIKENEIIIGRIIIEGESIEEDLTIENSISMIEKRIIGSNCTYYLFIIIRAKKIQSKIINLDDHKMIEYFNKCKLDALSRIIDYYLDIYNNDVNLMTQLCLRDKMITQDPIVIIAKLLILYNSKEFKSIKNNLPEDIDDVQYFHIMDNLLTPNSRTDWLISNDIKSGDKAQVFAPQILLKQELFELLKSTNESNYEDLIINGDIYILDGYEWIKKFIAFGANTFSTEALNQTWKKFI